MPPEDRHSGVPGGGGGFTYEYSDSVESDTPTTSITRAWETVHAHTVVTAGDYIVLWSFELSLETIAQHVFGRVLHNTTTIGNYDWENEDITPDPYLVCTGFKKLTLAVNDTIELQYNYESSAGIEKRMRRCRVLLIAA